MGATLRDIARKAGVSTMTVSRSLNGKGPPAVSSVLRTRIRKVANQLGYHPNVNARALARNKSLLVGVLYDDVNFLSGTRFLTGLQEICGEHDYAPLFLSHQNAAMEQVNLRLCLRRNVDALIINPWVENDGRDASATHYDEIIKSGMPMVEVFGRRISGICSVGYDHFAAGQLATRHLIEHGHRRIVLFTHAWYRAMEKTPGLCFDAYEQWRGYVAEMRRIGAEPVVVTHPLAFQPTLRNDSMTFYNAALEGVREVFDHPAAPTAVVCYSMYQALAVLTMAQTRGVDIPARVSVICVDDFGFTWPVGRRIASIIQNPMEAGRIAAQRVLAQIDGKKTADAAIAPTLDPGETVADINATADSDAGRSNGQGDLMLAPSGSAGRREVATAEVV